MKTIKTYFAIAIVGLLFMTSCSKEETMTYDVKKSTTDGQARFKGTVTYLDAATNTNKIAPWAVIKIASDTTTRVFNQYWMADENGSYNVKGLSVGSYYIASHFDDEFTGARYESAGAIVIVRNSIDDITLDFVAR